MCGILIHCLDETASTYKLITEKFVHEDKVFIVHKTFLVHLAN